MTRKNGKFILHRARDARVCAIRIAICRHSDLDAEFQGAAEAAAISLLPKSSPNLAAGSNSRTPIDYLTMEAVRDGTAQKCVIPAIPKLRGMKRRARVSFWVTTPKSVKFPISNRARFQVTKEFSKYREQEVYPVFDKTNNSFKLVDQSGKILRSRTRPFLFLMDKSSQLVGLGSRYQLTPRYFEYWADQGPPTSSSVNQPYPALSDAKKLFKTRGAQNAQKIRTLVTTFRREDVMAGIPRGQATLLWFPRIGPRTRFHFGADRTMEELTIPLPLRAYKEDHCWHPIYDPDLDRFEALVFEVLQQNNYIPVFSKAIPLPDFGFWSRVKKTRLFTDQFPGVTSSFQSHREMIK